MKNSTGLEKMVGKGNMIEGQDILGTLREYPVCNLPRNKQN